jgi:hypothetical protein
MLKIGSVFIEGGWKRSPSTKNCDFVSADSQLQSSAEPSSPRSEPNYYNLKGDF